MKKKSNYTTIVRDSKCNANYYLHEGHCLLYLLGFGTLKILRRNLKYEVAKLIKFKRKYNKKEKNRV
jgi:hypothetical protein